MGRPSGPSTRPPTGTFPGVSDGVASGGGTAASACRCIERPGPAADFCEGPFWSETKAANAPQTVRPAARNVSDASVSFWSNMTLNTFWASFRAAGETAQTVIVGFTTVTAARTVASLQAAGTAARASRSNTAPRAAPSGASPRRASRRRSRARPSASRCWSVRLLQCNCPAACAWVIPSRSQWTSARRYFSGSRSISSCSTGINSSEAAGPFVEVATAICPT